MFDELVAVATRSRGVDAVAAWARAEAAACARRLNAMVAILDARQSADGSAEREQWYLDNWGAVCAELGAAQQITSAAASKQLLVATALRDRLPQVAAAFARGQVTYQLASTVTWRTAAIKSPDALGAVDTELADALIDWPPMSQYKTIAAIDEIVIRHDPHALRRTQARARSRHVTIDVDDASGTATLWGELFAADAKALDRRLHTLAQGVCDGDPRTLDQRRADATGALATGADRLACLCQSADCPAAQSAPAPSAAVIFVVAHQDTITDDSAPACAQDQALDGQAPPMFDKPVRELTLTEALTDTDPGEPAATAPGVMIDGPVLAGPIIRRLALAARIKQVLHPGAAPPETRYVPSAALADFVRCRDLSCRFPGCDAPATACDLDHTVAYPAGPTCASNLKCLCRFHHLLKTFWSGPGGWRDDQSPDGTVVWTAPGGQRYTTLPGSRVLFPELSAPTAPVHVTAARRHERPNTGLTMPRRPISRAAARARRIAEERGLNETDPQQHLIDTTPPF